MRWNIQAVASSQPSERMASSFHCESSSKQQTTLSQLRNPQMLTVASPASRRTASVNWSFCIGPCVLCQNATRPTNRAFQLSLAIICTSQLTLKASATQSQLTQTNLGHVSTATCLSCIPRLRKTIGLPTASPACFSLSARRFVTSSLPTTIVQMQHSCTAERDGPVSLKSFHQTPGRLLSTISMSCKTDSTCPESQIQLSSRSPSRNSSFATGWRGNAEWLECHALLLCTA